MAAPSACHQFATEATAIFSSVAARLPKRLKVTVKNFDTTLCHPEQGFRLYIYITHRCELHVTLEGRTLRRSLQELHELMEDQELHELVEVSLEWRSHSQEKRNESEFASGIQDLVEPLPQITVFIFWHGCEECIFLDAFFEHFLGALFQLVVKFRTKLHFAFSTLKEYESYLQTAIDLDYVGLAKRVVAMEPLRISNKSWLCPATVMAKVMNCVSTLEVVTLLLEIYRDPPFDQPNFLQTIFEDSHPWDISKEYADLFLKHIGTLPHFRRWFDRNPVYSTDELYDTMKWFGSDITTSYPQNQKVPGVWNLTAEVNGLLLPERHACWSNSQVLKLQVSLKTAVTGACSMAIGVRNVQVRIQNASLDSSPSNLLGFFLSHITVSIRPQVEGHQVLLMLLEVPSPNEPYDISATRTIGVSATAKGARTQELP
ncbi:hypothetical protein CY35_08G116300 [Sphagnum magellanicum]|nr:hypothetical protein CY35_08G116300 [Sphagnum magellanicum]